MGLGGGIQEGNSERASVKGFMRWTSCAHSSGQGHSPCLSPWHVQERTPWQPGFTWTDPLLPQKEEPGAWWLGGRLSVWAGRCAPYPSRLPTERWLWLLAEWTSELAQLPLGAGRWDPGASFYKKRLRRKGATWQTDSRRILELYRPLKGGNREAQLQNAVAVFLYLPALAQGRVQNLTAVGKWNLEDS